MPGSLQAEKPPPRHTGERHRRPPIGRGLQAASLGGRFAGVCLAAALALGGPSAVRASAPGPGSEPPVWTVTEDSTLTVAYRGSPVGGTGTFEVFEASIAFDPDDPAATRLSVIVETGSLRLGDITAQRMVGAPRWFDTAAFPLARFDTVGAIRMPSVEEGGSETASTPADGSGTFATVGTLTIKGKEASVPLTFTVTIDGDEAVAEVFATVDRTVFGLGVADPEESAAIATDVEIEATVRAVRATGGATGR